MGFGSNIFQAARIAIDGVTIVENITNGTIQSQSGIQYLGNIVAAELTTTSATNLLSLTTTLNTNYMVMVYADVVTATTTTTIACTYTDAAGAQTYYFLNGASKTTGAYSFAPLFINVTANSVITVTATAATANQVYVSSAIYETFPLIPTVKQPTAPPSSAPIFRADANGNSPSYFISITLTNNQANATGTNFQQMVVINSVSFASYLSATLSNVCFQDGAGNLIKSWLESGETNAAAASIYWLLLPNSISARGTQTIYMTLQSVAANSIDGITTGAEPNYTGSYGQYDNAASIFIYYTNFTGLSLPSNWSFSGTISTNYTVNNGLQIGGSSASASTYGLLYSSIQTSPYVFEGLITAVNGASFAGAILLNSSLTTTFNTISGSEGSFENAYQFGSENTKGNNTYLAYVSTTSRTVLNSGQTFTFPAVKSLVWSTTGSITGSSNYTSLYTNTNSALSIANSYISLTGRIQASVTSYMNVQWLRTRVIPPNVVMPSISFGQLIFI